MNLSRRSILKKSFLLTGSLIIGSQQLYSKTLMTLDEAKKVLSPGKSLKKVPVTLTKEQAKSIKKASKVKVRNLKLNAWKTSDGGWFIVDHVIGKHEFIDYAITISPKGAIRGIEVLTYRESYGYEITRPRWQSQILGKTLSDPLKIDRDIKNISGATLSCEHLTEGARRMLHTWKQVLSTY